MSDSPRRGLGLSGQRQELLRRLLEQAGAASPADAIKVASGEALSLSYGQERLWVLDQMVPGNAAYNVVMGERLEGRLEVGALRRGLEEVVRRHRVLRSRFGSLEGRPVQVVEEKVEVDWEEEDLRGEGEEEVRRRASWEAGRGFDLKRGGLLRGRLLRLGEEEWLLLVTMHHIVSDGWSLGVLKRELGELYGAYREGRESPLEELGLQYGDYAAWQREWLGSGEGSELEKQLGYWRERLRGARQVLELPWDRPRPAQQSFRGEELRLELGRELGEGLRELSRRAGVTLFMTLLAGFGVLLGRQAGEREVLVGTPIAGRRRRELEGLIGFFVNSLVMRLEVDGKRSFGELLEGVREVALEAYDHQELPFERLVEELQPERDLSRTPLFQAFFNHVNVPDPPLRLAGLRATPYRIPAATANFDLTLYVNERGPRLDLELVYYADLFEAPRMRELLQQYRHLLEQAVADPRLPAGRLSLVTPSARSLLPDPRARLDASWRGSVHGLFSEQARREPERTAVRGSRSSWTYGELDLRSDQLARLLAEGGVEPEAVVAIHARRVPALVLALMGVLKAGAAFTILDPAYPAARLAQYLELARPSAWLELGGVAPLAAELDGVVGRLCRCRLALPEDPAAAARSPLASFPPGPPGREVDSDSLAYVAFTSGSTGEPKGVLGRHGPLTHFLPWTSREFGLDASDRFSMLSGLAHDPLHRDVFTPLPLGATICCPDAEDIAPGRLPAWMRASGVTVAHLTPALGQVLVEPAPGAEAGSIPSLRRAFFVGDVLTRRDAARLQRLAPAVTIVNYYGSTETQRAVSHLVLPVLPDPPERPEKEILPLGRGIEDVQLLVLSEHGQLAGVGELGELHLRSPHLARGYLEDDALSGARFLPNPFGAGPEDRVYRTGDLGRYLPDGGAEPLGRADRQVKVRGFRVEPGEVEAVLGRHPAVKEAAVRALPAAGGARELAAYVVTRLGASDRELREFVRARLPDYMVPSRFVRLEALPLTPNGKLDVAALPAAEPARPRAASGRAAPLDGVAGAIAAVWRDVLRLDEVGLRDNFFDLGGNSLDVTRVHARLQERFGSRLTIVDLFRHPDIASLAELLEAAGAP